MKTTSKLLTACATAALGLSSAPALAGPPLVTMSLLSAAGIGQTDPAKEAEDLLRRARELMDEGNFETAESYIDRAEKLGVRPGLFGAGDSPAKARKDLARRRNPGQVIAGQSPGGFLQFGRQSQPQEDPFLRQTATANTQPAGAAAPGVPARLPTVGAASALPAQTGDTASRTRSDALLLESRKALATGDVRRASAAVEQAKALGVPYGFTDDSPTKVEATIRKFTDLNAPGLQRESDSFRRQYSDFLLEQSQALLRFKQFDDAERLAHDARAMGAQYNTFDTRPETVLERINVERQAARTTSGPAWANQGVQQAGAPAGQFDVVPAAGVSSQQAGVYPGATAAYNPTMDQTRTVAASNDAPAEDSAGARLFQEGQQALKAGNVDLALQHFRDAYKFENELDPVTRHRLQEHLQLLSAPATQGRPGENALIDSVTAQQQLHAKQVSSDVNRQMAEARGLMEKDPKKSLEMLNATRSMVESNEQLESGYRANLLSRVDLSIREVNNYLTKNKDQIELDAQNRAVRDDIDRRRQLRVEVDEKLALLVNDYNRLVNEGRYPEAEVIAKQAGEIAPDNPVVAQLREQSRVLRRIAENNEIRGGTEAGTFDVLTDVARSAQPFVGPYEFPDAKQWGDLTKRRKELEAQGSLRRTPREMEIERKLSTPVALKFNGRPLVEVLDYLAKVSQVNMYIDPKGLAEEAVTTDAPVTIDLSQDISMKSALTLILEPFHLSYVIENDVLKITSAQMRHGKVYTKTYNVADLVIPIPNFVARGHTGMSDALNNAYDRIGYNSPNGFGAAGGHSPVAVLASADGASNSNTVLNPALLAQMNAAGLPVIGGGGPPVTGMPQGVARAGAGAGAGFAGGSQADFDQLIELITTTIRPESWDEVGGPGAIQEFDTNLSLVVSQTQEVHDEIVDLLQQLRRLQDLQVTIEVRFITLRDDFFEQIGVDFDVKLEDNAPRDQNGNPILRDDQGSSVTIGLDPTGIPTADLDLQFNQNNATEPLFGGFAGPASTFGFAILSDIEAYFLIEAAQGDTRTNVLQAPKVTLFNGQSATISDVSERNFVTSVTPVVGDFAAAQQPVIMVLSEGTSLTVQAVISNDRRFVRMTVVPFFSQIGDVEEFTFEGSRTTRKGSKSTTDDDDKSKDEEEEEEIITTGTTVQQPVLSSVTVSTTVSVPDGGTVLLGGIKRLQEGRTERGLPILSKLPYINRLFRNVSIGRNTSSLMIMVTPRIIIQEEEEERLGIAPAGATP